MVRRQLAGAAIAVIAVLGPAGAQAPNLKEIPLYPGAALPPANEDLPSPMLGITLDSSRRYVVRAPLETMVKFYQQRLSARKLSDADFEQALERADAEPVAAVFTVAPHWVRFVWSRRQPGGAIATFGVSMVDGYQARGSSEPATVLAIGAGVATAGAEPAETGEPDEARSPDEAASPQTPSRPLPEPSAAELGVPRYPGARFDGTNSAALSSGGDHYYVYTTADAPEKVAAFYERQTGKKGLKREGGWLIAVKGAGLFPELGVTVQPNAGTYPATVKTMITVRHGKPGN